MDNLILYFGINGIESLILILFVIGFSFKNVGKFNLILTWLFFNSFNYGVSKFIGIPPIDQIIIILLGGVMLSVMLDLQVKKCIGKSLIMFILCIIFETSNVIILQYMFYISYFNLSVFNQFTALLPSRVLELMTLFLISGGVVKMKFWWNDIKRKQPTKK